MRGKMERYKDSQTWYAVFDRSYSGFKWWHSFLHPKFRHVHLLRDNRDCCLMVNSFQHVMAIREYPNTVMDIIQQEIAQNPTAILQFTVHYGSHYKPSHIEPLTCVTVAKRILGIRNRWVMTPKRLYHEMIKAGAEVIKPYCIT